MSDYLDACGVSTQFIQAMIESDHHHVGTIEHDYFVPALKAPDDPRRGDVSHGLMFFERNRVFVRSDAVAAVQGFLARRYGGEARDLFTAEVATDRDVERGWGDLFRPYDGTADGLNTVQLMDRLGWRVLDLRGIPAARERRDGIAWDIRRDFARQEAAEGRTGNVVELVRAIPMAPFDDCAAGSSARPTPDPRESHRAGGEGVTVLVLDSGRHAHTSFNDVGVVDPTPFGTGVIDDDDVFASPLLPQVLRHGAAHGTFIAGLIRSRAAQAEVLLADVTDGATSPSGYIVDEMQLLDSLCRGLLAARNRDVIVNLSIATDAFSQRLAGPFTDFVRRSKAGALGEVHSRLSEVAQGAHLVYVAAGGNHPNRSAQEMFPANLPEVLAVGALDAAGTDIAWFSVNRGVDAWAIGQDRVGPYAEGILPAIPNAGGPYVFGTDPWARWSGTSFAAPIVVAAIARAFDGQPSVQAAWVAVAAAAPQRAGVPVID